MIKLKYKLPTNAAEVEAAWQHVTALLATKTDAGERQAIAEARALIRAGTWDRTPKITEALNRLSPILARRGIRRHVRHPGHPGGGRAARRRGEARRRFRQSARAARLRAAFHYLTRRPDVIIAACGTFVLLRPETEHARKWCEANLAAGTSRYKTAYAIEARYLPPIVHGLEASGLTVKGDETTEAQGLTRVGGTPTDEDVRADAQAADEAEGAAACELAIDAQIWKGRP